MMVITMQLKVKKDCRPFNPDLVLSRGLKVALVMAPYRLFLADVSTQDLSTAQYDVSYLSPLV